jgi:hypothetical protein
MMSRAGRFYDKKCVLLGARGTPDSPVDSLILRERTIDWAKCSPDISPLSGMTQLTSLSLGSNQISDIAPLVANPGLGKGAYMYLYDNPLSKKALKEQVPALQKRGVNVILEAPPRRAAPSTRQRTNYRLRERPARPRSSG